MRALGRVASQPAWEGLCCEGLAKARSSPWCCCGGPGLGLHPSERSPLPGQAAHVFHGSGLAEIYTVLLCIWSHSPLCKMEEGGKPPNRVISTWVLGKCGFLGPRPGCQNLGWLAVWSPEASRDSRMTPTYPFPSRPKPCTCINTFIFTAFPSVGSLYMWVD